MHTSLNVSEGVIVRVDFGVGLYAWCVYAYANSVGYHIRMEKQWACALTLSHLRYATCELFDSLQRHTRAQSQRLQLQAMRNNTCEKIGSEYGVERGPCKRQRR